jgi:hypothetical protein
MFQITEKLSTSDVFGESKLLTKEQLFAQVPKYWHAFLEVVLENPLFRKVTLETGTWKEQYTFTIKKIK